MKLERDYQLGLIERIEEMFPGAHVLRNNPRFFQGVPDLSVFYRDRWGMLEVKREEKSERQPNQTYWAEVFNSMSFCAVTYPENEREVLHALEQSLKSGRSTRRPQS